MTTARRPVLIAAGSPYLELRQHLERQRQGANLEARDEHFYDWYNRGGCTLPRGIGPGLCSAHAREKQHPPEGDWLTWLIRAGRGFGKTRTGAEWTRDMIQSGRCGRFALLGRNPADVRDIMIKGEAGILAVSPPWFKPLYSSATKQLTWPNGAICKIYSSEVPDQLRGPAHDGAWCDELAKFKHLDDPENNVWDNLQMGLRLGRSRGHTPQCVVTTTPRPIPTIKKLLKDPTVRDVQGHTNENIDNLSEQFKRAVVDKYEGTRTGRQELAAELLEDVEGALWTQRMIDEGRIDTAPELARIVVALDPSGSDDEGADEVGIVSAGRAPCHCKGTAETHYFVLRDDSGIFSPNEWGSRAVYVYHTLSADRLVGEANFGGQMVQHTIATVDKNVAYKAVTASRSKTVRAEPIAALSEQGKVHFVGPFPKLETQLTTWVQGMKSPDRLDAYVWALTELLDEKKKWGGAV